MRNHAVKTGSKLNLRVIFVANKNVPCDLKLPFEMKICSRQKDSADNYIFENVKQNDLVITRDIVFADKLVKKGIATLNDRGTIFSPEITEKLLSERDFDLQLAQIGLVKRYNEGYDKKKFSNFANAFDKTINKLLKNQNI